MGRQNSWTDQKTEEIIGTLLRAGVTLAASVVLAGGLLYLVRHGGEPADYKVFRGEPTDLRQVGSIVRDAVTRRSRGLIQLGILLLIATPIARVVFAVFAFAKERDKMYVVFTLIVLAILMYSLIGWS
jgi:uncharacterized membrane protein